MKDKESFFIVFFFTFDLFNLFLNSFYFLKYKLSNVWGLWLIFFFFFFEYIWQSNFVTLFWNASTIIGLFQKVEILPFKKSYLIDFSWEPPTPGINISIYFFKIMVNGGTQHITPEAVVGWSLSGWSGIGASLSKRGRVSMSDPGR